MNDLRQTLPGRMLDFARKWPARPALREKQFGIWQEITWSAYADHVAAAARMLAEWNIGAGDIVTILSENRCEWLYADLAAQAIGAASAGIYQTNPPHDVAYILNHSRAKILFCEDQEQLDKAIAIAADTPTVQHVVVFDPRGTRGYSDPRVMAWRDFLAQGQALLQQSEPGWFEARVQGLDPQAPAMIVYTSGTTGDPKGAMLSSANALSGADATVGLMGGDERDVILSYLPLCHVAEKIFSLFLPLTTGAVVHFGEAIETIQEDLRDVSPTIFLGVPRIWEKMHASVSVKMRDASWLKRKLFDFWVPRGQAIAQRRLSGAARLSDRLLWALGDLFVFRPLQERLGLRRCRVAISGAAPISRDLLAWFHGIGIEIQEGFGMTESAGVSHLNWPGRTKLGTVGELFPHVEFRLGDDGEILLRGPNVFLGYLHNDEATRQTIDAEGWLHTGDIGTVDADGYLTITGRAKEIIITSGGKNLSPEKIENAMKTSPYVKEAIAIGDGRNYIAALIQIEADIVGDWATRRKLAYTSFEDLSGKPEVETLIEAEVKRCNELLARVEQVRKFKLLRKELHQDDGELTATQKVKRRNVQKLYAELIASMY